MPLSAAAQLWMSWVRVWCERPARWKRRASSARSSARRRSGTVSYTHLDVYKRQGKSVTIRDLAGTYGKLDLQGPATVRVMTKLLKDPEAVFDKLPYFSFKGDIELANSDIFLADGTPIFLSRTGYTGEQGFEIFVPYDKIVDIWNRILEAGKDEGVIPCGLAARDSVRAGAVLPLSQQDIGPWAFVNNPWPCLLYTSAGSHGQGFQGHSERRL